MVTDPVSDLLTRIRNAALAGQHDVVIPHSKLKLRLANIFKEAGYLEEVKTSGDESPKLAIKLTLKYHQQTGGFASPVIQHIRRISKPGQRRYVDHKNIPNPRRGLGMVVVSTSKGMITGKEAKKQHLGGELICEIW